MLASLFETVFDQFWTVNGTLRYIDVGTLVVLVALNHISPNLGKTQGIRIADDKQKVLGTGDGHVESAQVSQEAESG